MDFVPDNNTITEELPYFEDVNAALGWAGHSTKKTEEELMAEIAMAIGRLGGMVNRWVSGSLGERHGYRVLFNLQGGASGKIEIIALPIRTKISSAGYETKKKQAIKMALFNLRNQLQSLWRMQQLIPGYFGLLPMMLMENTNNTFGQLWIEHMNVQSLLPAPRSNNEEVLDGIFEVVEE